MQNEDTEKYWSRFSETYEQNQAYVVGKDFIEEIGKELSKLPKLGKTVELGCGTGVYTELILPKTTHLVATDLSNTNVGMRLLDKFKLGVRFLKVWGKPPKHTHIFSPEKLAALMECAGFVIQESKLIGNRSKALFAIGKKG